jgi:oxygen-dependent protoporphyrinogen oxidase
MTRHVVVVGGGITGLSAAWELSHDPTTSVTVLEASDRFGGRIQTSSFAGRMVDEGADAFLRRVPEGLRLAVELGLEDGLVSPAATSALVWSRGELRPLPPGLVLGVPTDADALVPSGILSDVAIDAVRAEPNLAGAPLGGDESVGSLIRRRFGDEVLEQLVEPLVGGINAGEADRQSVDAVVPQIAAAARRSASLTRGFAAVTAEVADAAAPAANPTSAAGPVFAAPRAGMGSLISELVAGLAARGVELATGVGVEGIEPGVAGWVVLAGGAKIEADAVIITSPAPVASRLVEPLAPAAAEGLAAIDHASVALVALAIPNDQLRRPLDGSGYLVPRTAGLTITATSWSSSKWAHLAGDDDVIMRVSCGHRDDPGPTELDDDDLVAAVLADLSTTMAFDPSPTALRITRYPNGFPQYDVGHLDRVAAIEAELRDQAPGIVVCGSALRGLGVPACIRQGREAARAVIGTAIAE